jgi:tripartite-type tricarboxylate transporter receptor subunit TctC
MIGPAYPAACLVAASQEGRMCNRRRRAAAATLGLALLCAAPAHCERWPDRPVTMVIPLAAGSGLDVFGRLLAASLSELLGQPVVIENIGNAGGMTGAARVAKAVPDGYQILLGTVGTHAQNQTLYRHPLYNAATDFAPVLLLAEQPTVLLARKDLPADDLAGFIAYANANHARMQYGSAGAGSAAHLACALLNARAGIDVTHVPYRGGAAAMQDLLAGRIDYQCPASTLAMPQIEAGKVKGIALLAKDRLPQLPQLATAHEQGLAGFEAGIWYALFLPRNAPAAIIDKLHDAAAAALDTPALRDRLSEIGVRVVAPDRRSPEYLARFVASEIEKWAVPIRASGVSVE